MPSPFNNDWFPILAIQNDQVSLLGVCIWVVLDKDDLIPTLRRGIDEIKATHNVFSSSVPVLDQSILFTVISIDQWIAVWNRVELLIYTAIWVTDGTVLD